MNWQERKVLVTEGASFIGSHLVDALVKRAALVRVVDDLSSGRIENIKGHIKNKRIEFCKGELRDSSLTRKVMKGQDIVFHLAAEKIDDGTAVNLGTRERVKVMDAVRMVLEFTNEC